MKVFSIKKQRRFLHKIDAIDDGMAVEAQLSSKMITFIQILQTNMNRKCPKSRKVESEIKTLKVQLKHLSKRRITNAGLLIRVGGATERSFRKMELLEFEEKEENNARIDIDVDGNFDNTDLFCGEVDEDDDLCSSCDENPFAHLVQPCGHMICTNCVKKINCQFCGIYKLALSGADRGH